MGTPPALGFRSVSDRLGAWNFYFIAKLVLFALGLVGLHLVENLVFAAVLFAMAAPRARRYRPWVGVPVAVALLYYDSWLPGFSRVVSQAGLVAGFSAAYLAELAGRFVNVKVIAILAAVLAACAAVARLVRIDAIVVAAMVAMALLLGPPGAQAPAAPTAAGTAPAASAPPQSPDTMLAEFFRKEAQRAVAFARPPAGSPDFDVIFLHVCSLSWDDLAATRLDQHPLLASFDIVLRRFNTVSTYSGPAVIRFLRAPCGQAPHRALYAPTEPRCLLMPGLEQAGFEVQLVLNHDGHFDDFLGHVRAQGIKAAPLPIKDTAAPMRAFDDSRIHDDGAVLARWLQARPKAAAPRVAAYYNTVSLHDGNRLAANPGVNSSETYRVRTAKLLDDLQEFIDKLAASGRRAVVVMVPEHGAAWRGDAAQIAGLREIPTPAITLVPVGIRVVGPDARRVGEALQVAEPASFLAVSHIVARMLARPPYGAPGFRPADYTAGMPLTDFVAEGEAATVVRRGDAYLLRQERDAWKELR